MNVEESGPVIIKISVKMVKTPRNRIPQYSATEPVGHIEPMLLNYKLPLGRNHTEKFPGQPLTW